jgi:hypothetical protein
MQLPLPGRTRTILSIAIFSALMGSSPAADDASNAQPSAPVPATHQDYGLIKAGIEELNAKGIPFIDYHVHLRGGMTVDKAVTRQTTLGIKLGVLRNLGEGWPIENDKQLATFLQSVSGRPVFVGLQVNDRDWHKKHAPDLLKRVDYFLGDTMIMPMPNDQSPPVKLFKPESYTISDPEAWMKRYIKHNLRVLAEPISILANPTYLPPAVADLYDELWTDARMKTMIRAAIANNVALEINARSGYPHKRFIRIARKMGATFSFGSNNFDDIPISLKRCFQAINTYNLGKNQLFVPSAAKH